MEASGEKLEGLSQTDVARLLGCAQSTVTFAIRRGEIQTLANGRIGEDQVEIVRELWARDQRVSEETAALQRRLLEAETGEKEAKAKLRQLELERQAGRFVELAVVQKDAADCSERVIAILRAVPQRCALALECGCKKAAVVEGKLREEVERAIAEMSESEFVRAEGP